MTKIATYDQTTRRIKKYQQMWKTKENKEFQDHHSAGSLQSRKDRTDHPKTIPMTFTPT